MTRYDDDLDLDELAGELEAPPPSDALLAAIDDMGASGPRRPRRQWLIVVAASLAFAAGLIAINGLRRNLGELPTWWFVAYLVAWFTSFAATAWWALVPAPGRVLLRWRACAAAAIGASLVFTVGGLAFAQYARDLGAGYEATPGTVWEHGQTCLRLGLVTALVPAALATLFLRRAVPVRSRWIAAAFGASAGAVGGLMLHLHCPIAERFHLGLIHGGVVVIAAIASALVAPRFTRS